MHSATVADGSWVYIESNFERYSGFKYVVEVNATSFKIRDQLGGDEITFLQESDISFQISDLEHTWQSVHLPIVYELSNDRYPQNSIDDELVIDSVSNSNGYLRLVFTSPLGTFEALDYVKIFGADDSRVNGTWQIIDKLSTSQIVIDLAYDATYDFTNSLVQLTNNNYFIEVDVYSGLESGHRWDDQKPSQLVATLRLIPDESNNVKFSIAEILKGDITTRNNLQLDTLPNNLDFYTQFHIAFRECYDVSDGSEISVFVGDTTTDSFIGNAVNSQMPFKSLNQSFMSDYLDVSGVSLARWLTLLDRPVAVIGLFFDLSFINQHDGDLQVTIFKSVSGTVTNTEVIELPEPGIGVLRIPIDIESGYDLYCLQAATIESTSALSLASMANTSTGVAWSLGANPSITVTINQNSQILFIAYAFQDGVNYTLTANFDNNITAALALFRLGAYDSSNNLIGSQQDIESGVGSGTVVFDFVGDSTATRIGIRVAQGPIGGGSSFTITSLHITTPAGSITEQICIDIIEECGSTFTNDNLRITETDLFRELE